MDFCKFTNEFKVEGYTLVDNRFIAEHLPTLDENEIKVYLYGLFVSSISCADMSEETLLDNLCLSRADVVSVYERLQDLNLVKIESLSPLQIKYLSAQTAHSIPKKYKTSKWTEFNRDLQQLFPERMLSTHEYIEYYEFFDNYKFDLDAMLLVVKYCINLKGDTIKYPYILTVAKNWALDGVKTVQDVEKRLQDYSAQTDDIRQVLQALKRKGGAELEEQQLYQKWVRSWGYSIDAILATAKILKGSKNFKKIDALLDEFYRLDIFTPDEIADWARQKQELVTLAININKKIGVYYESLDNVIETYTSSWLNKGFDGATLLTIADHCFRTGVRTLDGMNNIISKFYKNGIITTDSIGQYLSAQVQMDKKIKAIIAKTNRNRNVTSNDREMYKIWTVDWGFDDELILYAASNAGDRTYPVPYINQLLSGWRVKGISQLDQAKKDFKAVKPSQNKTKFDYEQRTYSDEELKSLSVSLNSLSTDDL